MGLLIGMAGLISVIRLLKFLRIKSRKAGALLLLFGFVLMIAGGALLPPVEEELLAVTGPSEEYAAAYTAPELKGEETEAAEPETGYKTAAVEGVEFPEAEVLKEKTHQGRPPFYECSDLLVR